MRFLCRFSTFLAVVSLMTVSVPAADSQLESISEVATHQQSRTIAITDGDQSLTVNAFCLDDRDNIVAVCGAGPGQVRILDQQGETIRSWEIEIKPESIHVDANNTVLVGGEGKLFRFDIKGELLVQADSPHAISMRENREDLRKAAIQALQPAANMLERRIESYERIITMLEEKSENAELNEQETRMLESLPKTLATWKEERAEELEGEAKEGTEDDKKNKGPSEEKIQERIDMMVRSKMRISSITSGDEHVFVTTRSTEGYGFDVWKINHELTGGEILITGLSGCCGQMDVQCCRKGDETVGLFVAENSRGQVAHYGLDGEAIHQWGKKDRTGKDGFTSCCNPMNVCFNAGGDVYTAESSTGRIKRFSAGGELLDFVGDVELVPGCKNVSIAVSKKTDAVLMLDITRGHVIVMEPKTSEPANEEPANNEPTNNDLAKAGSNEGE